MREGQALPGALYPAARVSAGRVGLLAAQTIGAAESFASVREDVLAPAHLLVAVLDQSDAGVRETLSKAGLNGQDLRRVALDLLRAPSDLPSLPMPPPIPAGTTDRPPLEISEFNPGAWAYLCRRQARLPLDRLRRVWPWNGLWSLERGASGASERTPAPAPSRALRPGSGSRKSDDSFRELPHHLDRCQRVAGHLQGVVRACKHQRLGL